MLLDQLLEKLGLKFENLSKEERATYVEWAKILSKTDITIEDLKKVLPKELERANTELRNYENLPKKQVFYQAYASLLATLTQMIVTPASQRQALQAHLKKKFNIDI
jgi:5-bromo-4-chloroindolyl phosphate hydrolysis protein